MKKRVFTKFMSMTLAAAIALSFAGVIHADETGEGDTWDIVIDDPDMEHRVVPDYDIDNDEMAERYIANKMSGSKSAEYRRFDFVNQLNEDEQRAFQCLNPIIAQIAAGERAGTWIGLPDEDFSMTVSTTEAGVETFEGLSQTEVLELVQNVIDKKFDTNKFINALMFANPDNMYWFDKTQGFGMNFTKVKGNDLLTVSGFTFLFIVADEYRGNSNVTVNTEYGQAVKSAAQNAGNIIKQNKDLDDYHKLFAYNNKICELTDYNRDAAGGGVSYGNPWQYIWVFDGDPNTKVVCEGYAKAFQYLCDNSVFRGDDVYAITVRGFLGGGGHQWNIVHMDDDKNYLVDVTNNDTNNTTALFMPGVAGSVSGGYSKNSLYYTYNPDTTDYFSEPQLTLSSTNYNPDKLYSLSLDYGAGGNASLLKTSAKAGELISITTNPDKGYEIDKITVNGKSVGGNQFFMPGRDVEVYVQFKKISYNITLNTGDGGTAYVPDTAYYGDLVGVWIYPSTGYELDKIKVNGKAISINSGYIFNMPAENVTVDVTFKKTVYNITVSDVTGRRVRVSSSTATYGDEILITATPNTGYEVDYIKVNGSAISGDSFFMPAGNVTIDVGFSKEDYSITVNAGDGGSATVSSSKANYQDPITVNAVPDTGYEVDQIKVNGEVISGTSFKMPAQNTKVDVTFKKIVYNIYAFTDTDGGSVDVSSATATYGEKITVTATPNTGYEVDYIKVNGNPISGNTFDMPAGNVIIEIAFKMVKYSITVIAGEGGSAGASATTANYQDLIGMMVAPQMGYRPGDIIVNGEVISGAAFYMPAADVIVEVTFEKEILSVSVNAGDGGSAKVSSDTATIGEDITVTATPDKGYEVDEIKVNDKVISGTTFKMPGWNVKVEVTFKKVLYNITLNTSEGGSAEISKTSANYGDEITLDITADDGYYLAAVKVNGDEIEGTGFEMPAGNVAVNVVFAKDQYKVTVNNTVNGTASVSSPSAEWGSEVSVNPVPANGYGIDKITYTPEGGAAVDITNAGKFTMPRAAVTVDVAFKKVFVPTPTATATPTATPKPAAPTDAPKATVKPSKPDATVTSKPAADSSVSIKLDKSSSSVVCGKTVTLKAAVKGTSSKVSWNSSNSKIASVDASGKVTAKQAGSATITATVEGKSAQCVVQVLFKDVTDTKEFWYAPTYYLVNLDVVKGYDKQTLFKPTVECTRAQMLTFMWRLAGSPAPKSTKCSFPDVKSSDYFFKPVIWAVEKGITTGYKDGTFKPQTVCSRAQTVTFLWRMAGKPNPKSTVNKFSDVKSSAYYYKATLWASEKKILAGYSDGTFKPDGLCLRRQMVTFLYKYDKFINGKG